MEWKQVELSALWEEKVDWIGLILQIYPGLSYLRQREESFRTANELSGDGEGEVYVQEVGQRAARLCGGPRLNRKKSRSGARLVVLWGLS